MRTDEQLKAIAFDKYLAAADAAGLRACGAAQTLRAIFASERALEIEEARYELALKLANEPPTFDEMKALMKDAGYSI
jgi:hypothetical protein